ncbi:MAG TPA: carbon-nitrogen family hydrolase [bacterium]|nr:carbon-nitrogen family hydrolase [bacterium]HPQ66989.1 carbon-nitrogen family hydrolase [bacterium]
MTVAQMNVVPADPEANLEKAEGWVEEAARRGSDLICFPEMWTTGFDWDANARLAPAQGETVARVAALARRHRIWINGSLLALDERGRPANTSILFNDRGEPAGVYRKTHLFSLLHEERHMTPGNALTVAETPWGRMGLSVCYDIRFPELFRTYALQGVLCVLSPMAFPYPRLDHWKILVRARAVENQMFMIGVNRVGGEEIGAEGRVDYFGDSTIVDPWGRTVVEASETTEELLTAALDLAEAEEIRARMTVLRDRRPELYRL